MYVAHDFCLLELVQGVLEEERGLLNLKWVFMHLKPHSTCFFAIQKKEFSLALSLTDDLGKRIFSVTKFGIKTRLTEIHQCSWL
jgi:hypothetical protein